MRLPLIIRLLISPIKFIAFIICSIPILLLALAGKEEKSDDLIGFILDFGN